MLHSGLLSYESNRWACSFFLCHVTEINGMTSDTAVMNLLWNTFVWKSSSSGWKAKRKRKHRWGHMTDRSTGRWAWMEERQYCGALYLILGGHCLEPNNNYKHSLPFAVFSDRYQGGKFWFNLIFSFFLWYTNLIRSCWSPQVGAGF